MPEGRSRRILRIIEDAMEGWRFRLRRVSLGG